MPRIPQQVLPQVLADLKSVFDQELRSVILYGSAAGDDFKLGLSDINLMVVVTPAGLNELGRLAAHFARWAKDRVAPPLVLTQAEIDSSLDSFPLEFLNMLLNHEAGHGPDPLAHIEINRDDLRLQCERELKGKLFVLREAVLASGGKEDRLLKVALDSIKAFAAIFRGVLYLLGEETGSLNSYQVLEKATSRLNLRDGRVLTEIWRLRLEGKPAPGLIHDLFRIYLAVIAEAAAMVDRGLVTEGD